MKRYLPTLIIILGLIAFYFYRYKRAPNLEFSEMEIVAEDGRTTNITSELGDNTVIHFYASWCGPCIGELNSIRKNTEMLQSLGLTFIFITDDTEDKIALIRENMPEEIKFYRINNLSDAGIYTLPTSYFLAGNEVIKKQVDVFDWSDKNELERLTFKR